MHQVARNAGSGLLRRARGQNPRFRISAFQNFSVYPAPSNPSNPGRDGPFSRTLKKQVPDNNRCPAEGGNFSASEIAFAAGSVRQHGVSCRLLLAILMMMGPPLDADPSADTKAYESRDWTSAQGTSLTARLLRFKDREHVVLARNEGGELTVALDQLSPADRAYTARIWAIENPVVLFGRGLYYSPSCADVASAMGRKIVDAGERSFPERLYSESRATRTYEHKILAGRAAKTSTAEPPVLIEDHWIWRLTDTQRRQGFGRAIRDLPGADGVENLRVILVDPVIPPAGLRRPGGGEELVPPEEMAGLIEAFRTEQIVPTPGLEIAPVRTVYLHVLDAAPEWKFSTNINMPTPRDLERIVVMATIFREKPPLAKLQKLQSSRGEPLVPGLLSVPEAKLKPLEDFILEEIQRANSGR